ncbi:MAG: hypothetical protein J2P17_20425, partial [Mycobacterium sp.]|nr:hypothetical protein [Mycobacterium sp.]
AVVRIRDLFVVVREYRAAAPVLSVFSVVVAACARLALLLAVELLNRALKRYYAETVETVDETTTRDRRDSRDHATGDNGRKSRGGPGMVSPARGVDCGAAHVGVLPTRAVAGAHADRRGTGPGCGHEQLWPQGTAALAGRGATDGETSGAADGLRAGPRPARRLDPRRRQGALDRR